MRRSERQRGLVLANVVMSAIAIMATRLLTDSWPRAVVYGVPLSAAVVALGYRDRRRAARALAKHGGRITIRGPVLILQRPAYDGGTVSVHAETMRELSYHYSVHGAWGANNWSLVYLLDNRRETIDIYEGDDALIVEPLRAWCVCCLPGFEPATFDRLVGSLGDDDEPGVRKWMRQEPGAAAPVQPGAPHNIDSRVAPLTRPLMCGRWQSSYGGPVRSYPVGTAPARHSASPDVGSRARISILTRKREAAR